MSENNSLDYELFTEDQLRALDFDDPVIQKLLALEKEYFPWPWTKENWLSFFGSPRNFSLTVIKKSENDEYVGYSLFEHFLLDEGCHLYKVLVTPELRGGSAARDLMTYHFNFLRKLRISNCYLEVATGNVQAIKFYEKIGLVRSVVKRKFYADGQDALVMTGSI